MNYRICRCCGEPMPETGNALSRNPNICASCSSMADGMDQPRLSADAALPAEPPGEAVPADVETAFRPAKVKPVVVP